jgi:hypothetical protein
MGNPLEGQTSPVTTTSNVVDVEAKVGARSSGKADAALEFLSAERTAFVSDVDERKLVRKIDWMIMPLMWACYNLQYLDKVLSTHRVEVGLCSCNQY